MSNAASSPVDFVREHDANQYDCHVTGTSLSMKELGKKEKDQQDKKRRTINRQYHKIYGFNYFFLDPER
jgi:hypothetical protein